MSTKTSLSSQQTQKKQREKELLDEFAALYADFPIGTLVESEEPDFLVQTGSQVLGIELLEFHKKEDSQRSSQIRQRESFHEQLAQRAQALFEAKYQIPLQVMLHGHGHQRNARPPELELLASCVADLVEQHIPQILFQTLDLDRSALRDAPVAGVIHSFSITRLQSEAMGVWVFSEASWPETSFDELQQEIAIKDTKVEKYLEQCSSVWLLIVVGGRYIATMAEFPGNLPEHSFQFRFERVLIYNRVTRNIFALTRDG
jgi:hypothetical protein